MEGFYPYTYSVTNGIMVPFAMMPFFSLLYIIISGSHGLTASVQYVSL